MRPQDPRAKLFSRRATLLIAGKVSLLGALLGRAYYLQVIEADQYKLQAEENRINLRLLVPTRGLIIDRFGRKLAVNRKNFGVEVVAEEAPDVAATLRRLQKIVPFGKPQLDRVLAEVKRKRGFVPVPVVDNLSWKQFSQVNVALPDLPGLHPKAGSTRIYPMAQGLAHVVGYVGQVSSRELNGNPLLEHPDFRIGKSGIEQSLEKQLRGRAGDSQIEVNAFGRVIRELKRRDPSQGQTVALTIDAELQQRVMRLLGENSAAATVMDIHGGEILALASNPAYDPNAFTLGITSKTWQTLLRNPRAPLANKAVTGQYPPGSTFKMLVALAALDAGLIDVNERVFCNGLYKYGNGRFHCWRAKYGGHGWVAMNQAVAQSCDVYFYEVAKRLGPDRIAAMANKLGLGNATGLGLPGERAGLIPTPNWKRAVLGERWNGGETLIAGIGQGYVLTTPVQLALMTARLANGGKAIEARLLRDLTANKSDNQNDAAAMRAAEAPPIGVAKEHLETVLAAMVAVVNSKKGTARSLRIDKSLGQMAGKTGTVQVRRITRAERAAGITKNVDRPWKDRDHSLFVAYGPVAAPKYAISVVIEHGGSGIVAGRLAKTIMEDLLRQDPLHRRAVGHTTPARRKAGGKGA
jgi:penicillin-binding protein 2